MHDIVDEQTYWRIRKISYLSSPSAGSGYSWHGRGCRYWYCWHRNALGLVSCEPHSLSHCLSIAHMPSACCTDAPACRHHTSPPNRTTTTPFSPLPTLRTHPHRPNSALPTSPKSACSLPTTAPAASAWSMSIPARRLRDSLARHWRDWVWVIWTSGGATRWLRVGICSIRLVWPSGWASR